MPWYKQKSTWTGIAIIVGAIASALTGNIDPETAAGICVGGLAMIITQGAVTSAKP